MKNRHPGVEVDISFIPAEAARARTFTRAEVERYNAEGCLANLPLFTSAEAAAWRDYFDANRKRLSDFKGGFKAFHHEVRELYDLVTHPKIVAWTKDLLGEDVVCHTSQYINKDPGDKTVVHWHQDCSYNPMDARSLVVLIAFDDMDAANGGLWVIPHSHLVGQLEFDPNPAGILETRTPESFGTPVALKLRAGEAVIFSDQLLHMSKSNTTTDRHRRTFNATYANTSLVPYLHKGDWAVLCAGQARHDRWKWNARP